MTVAVEELHPAGGVRTGDLSATYRRRRVIRSPWMPVRGSAVARSIGGKEEDAGDEQWLDARERRRRGRSSREQGAHDRWRGLKGAAANGGLGRESTRDVRV